jgi:hypothetical protein
LNGTCYNTVAATRLGGACHTTGMPRLGIGRKTGRLGVATLPMVSGFSFFGFRFWVSDRRRGIATVLFEIEERRTRNQ